MTWRLRTVTRPYVPLVSSPLHGDGMGRGRGSPQQWLPLGSIMCGSRGGTRRARAAYLPNSHSEGLIELLGQPLRPALDGPPVLVVAKCADPGPRLLEVLAGAAAVAQLAITIALIQVQRRIQASHRERHSGLGHPLIDDLADGSKRSQIPHQLLVHVVLHIGHRMAGTQTCSRSPCSPPTSSQICMNDSRAASRTALVVMQFHPLTNPSHRQVGDHGRLLHRRRRARPAYPRSF